MHLKINEHIVNKKDLNLYNHGTPNLCVPAEFSKFGCVRSWPRDELAMWRVDCDEL